MSEVRAILEIAAAMGLVATALTFFYGLLFRGWSIGSLREDMKPGERPRARPNDG